MFNNLLKAAIGVAILPLDVVSDVVTCGGAATNNESAIAKRLNHIGRNLDEFTK